MSNNLNVVVVIESDDCKELERLHYAVEARTNLIGRILGGVTPVDDEHYNRFMAEYEELYKDYTIFKERMESKYKNEQAANAVRWSADFDKSTITFEVPMC